MIHYPKPADLDLAYHDARFVLLQQGPSDQVAFEYYLRNLAMFELIVTARAQAPQVSAPATP